MKEDLFQATHLFKALGSPLRVRILRSLAHEPASPAALAREFQKTVQNVSQHLKVLRDADLVWFKSAGRSVSYMLKAPEVLELIKAARNLAAKRDLGPRKTGEGNE